MLEMQDAPTAGGNGALYAGADFTADAMRFFREAGYRHNVEESFVENDLVGEQNLVFDRVGGFVAVGADGQAVGR